MMRSPGSILRSSSRGLTRSPDAWLPALVPLVVLAAFLPTLAGDFVWDDALFLVDSHRYRVDALSWDTIVAPFELSRSYFRPFGVLSFIVELKAFGLEPRWFHLTNCLIHTINSCLVMALCLSLWPQRRRLAVVCALVYGLHPGLVEAVAFVSGRFDLLVTGFVLAFLLVDRTELSTPARLGLAFACFLLAAGSKEMAVCLVAVLPLWHLATVASCRGILTRWPMYAGAFAAGLCYLWLRQVALGQIVMPVGAETSLAAGSVLARALLVGRSLFAYARVMAWPFTTLSPLHTTTVPVPIGDGWAWLQLGCVTLAVGLLLTLVLRERTRDTPRMGTLAAAAAATLIPVANLLPLDLRAGSFAAEHFLPLPLALTVIAIVPVLLQSLPQRVVRVPIASWLVLSAVVVELTLLHWQTEHSLWTWATRRQPAAALAWTNLAYSHANNGDPDAALVSARTARELDPSDARAWDAEGIALHALGRLPEARDALRRATGLEPENPVLWSNLAGVLLDLSELDAAARILREEALARDPQLAVAQLNLGSIYLNQGRPDLAEPALRAAVALAAPTRAETARERLAAALDPARWIRLGTQWSAAGDLGRALAAFTRAEELGAASTDVVVGVSSALILAERFDEAQTLLVEELDTSANDARLFNNLGIVEMNLGRAEAAVEHFHRACALAPDSVMYTDNLRKALAGSGVIPVRTAATAPPAPDSN